MDPKKETPREKGELEYLCVISFSDFLLMENVAQVLVVK